VEEFDMSPIPKHITVAGVVLRDEEGRYLLVQEKQPGAYGLWNLPAGWVDEGESLVQAALREAREETGLEVELVGDEPINVADYPEKGRTLNAFLGRVVSGALKFQEEELLDARWLSLEKIKELESADKIRDPWVIKSIQAAETHENNWD
jgi:8-oxo-dGTP pyrophosphatase MutT (NUDIX family)